MKVKLDENLGDRGASIFREAGHDVATVVEQSMTSAPDDELLGVDRSAFSVSDDFDDDDTRRWWHHQTPEARIQHMLLLRRLNYGPRAIERLQRVLEIVE